MHNGFKEAYSHYKTQAKLEKPYKNWRYLIFHLPYAFHGKRVFSEIFSIENSLAFSTSEEQKLVAKSAVYLDFIKEKIEPSQRASSEIGNMYTASIFMALLSAFQVSYDRGEDLSNEKIGFLAYGSGSKAKVFTGKVGRNWNEVVAKWNLFESLKQRIQIDFETYEKLHRKQLYDSINPNYKGFGLVSIEQQNPVLIGARNYQFQ